MTKQKLKKKHKPSSADWLKRQMRDPYVAKAKAMGYRSRAAFKLIELDKKFQLLNKGRKVIDLGAAPGGWMQIALEKVGEGNVVGVDLLPIRPMAGAHILEGDFCDAGIQTQIIACLGGKKANLVLSDMAPNASGNKSLDHLRISGLCEEALLFALDHLAENGAFVCKIWQGSEEKPLFETLRARFTKVRRFKPDSSRDESAEIYVVATGFKHA